MFYLRSFRIPFRDEERETERVWMLVVAPYFSVYLRVCESIEIQVYAHVPLEMNNDILLLSLLKYIECYLRKSRAIVTDIVFAVFKTFVIFHLDIKLIC